MGETNVGQLQKALFSGGPRGTNVPCIRPGPTPASPSCRGSHVGENENGCRPPEPMHPKPKIPSPPAQTVLDDNMAAEDASAPRKIPSKSASPKLDALIDRGSLQALLARPPLKFSPKEFVGTTGEATDVGAEARLSTNAADQTIEQMEHHENGAMLTSVCKTRVKRRQGVRPPSRAFVRKSLCFLDDDGNEVDVGLIGETVKNISLSPTSAERREGLTEETCTQKDFRLFKSSTEEEMEKQKAELQQRKRKEAESLLRELAAKPLLPIHNHPSSEQNMSLPNKSSVSSEPNEMERMRSGEEQTENCTQQVRAETNTNGLTSVSNKTSLSSSKIDPIKSEELSSRGKEMHALVNASNASKVPERGKTESSELSDRHREKHNNNVPTQASTATGSALAPSEKPAPKSDSIKVKHLVDKSHDNGEGSPRTRRSLKDRLLSSRLGKSDNDAKENLKAPAPSQDVISTIRDLQSKVKEGVAVEQQRSRARTVSNRSNPLHAACMEPGKDSSEHDSTSKPQLDGSQVSRSTSKTSSQERGSHNASGASHLETSLSRRSKSIGAKSRMEVSDSVQNRSNDCINESVFKARSDLSSGKDAFSSRRNCKK